MKTVLAVIAAVALIAGALFVRSDVLDGRGLLEGQVRGAGTGSEGPDDDDEADVAGAPVAVACDASLGEGCPEGSQRLDLDDLLAAFAEDDEAHDVVIAPAVVIELIEQSQTSRVAFSAQRDPVARTALVVAALGTAAEGMAACGAEPTWGCAGDLLAAGELRPGFADPDSDSGGLVALAALTGGALGRTSYARQDLSGPVFLSLVDDLEAASPVGSDPPLLRLIGRNGAANNAALVFEAPTLATLAASQRTPPTLLWPTPLTAIDVVVVGTGDTDPAEVDAVRDAAAAALLDAGWRGPDGAPAGDGPPLPADDDGLPGGGVLFALQELWN